MKAINRILGPRLITYDFLMCSDRLVKTISELSGTKLL